MLRNAALLPGELVLRSAFSLHFCLESSSSGVLSRSVSLVTDKTNLKADGEDWGVGESQEGHKKG